MHHYVHQTSNAEASTFWAGCGAIYKTVFDQVAGFNSKYRNPSIEDIELGYRLKRHGAKTRLLKSLQVKHLKRWTAWRLIKTDFFQRALPWSEIIIRQGTFIDDLNISRVNRFSVALLFLLLFCTVAAPFLSQLIILSGLSAMSLICLNFVFYRFLRQKNGLFFAFRAIPWHWFYFFYSGLAFVLAGIKRVKNGPQHEAEKSKQ